MASGSDEGLHVAQVLFDVLRRVAATARQHEGDGHLVQSGLLLEP
jgi:hypothetical protein